MRFSLKNASLEADGPFAVELKNIKLDVRGGEVIAIAGRCRQRPIGTLRCDIRANGPCRDGNAVSIDGASCGAIGVNARRKMGAAFVPEERLGHGAVPAFPLVGKCRADPPFG